MRLANICMPTSAKMYRNSDSRMAKFPISRKVCSAVCSSTCRSRQFLASLKTRKRRKVRRALRPPEEASEVSAMISSIREVTTMKASNLFIEWRKYSRG